MVALLPRITHKVFPMPSKYKVAVNVEWTSKCNARCAMCPRSMISDPKVMDVATFQQVLARLTPSDVFRVIIAGYGEPTTHPRFDTMVEMMRGHGLRFDMATNGSLLDERRLTSLDGVLHTLMVSFSSVVPEVYQAVHTNLDLETVKANILAARRVLRNTRLIINLSPTAECLHTLDQTVAWFRSNGINDLRMSPTYYDRAGAQEVEGCPSQDELRRLIRRHNLTSQESGFIPGVAHIARQWWSNKFRCIPRNTNMLINAQGDYTFCFNDIRHSEKLANVTNTGLREALALREAAGEAAICGQCNLRGRYRAGELMRVAAGYFKAKLAA